ncbi:NAD(P)H-hydrate epimerase [Alkalibacterium olivapovliticus]|uniref:NAD(P)H-hydrate epimerase n=1 Tax=Alkalibacterium olivapovliticus TaxID=99907 RepID=A0A2T0WBT2_9LACT|nr:NAD(P)H-hydrate epimerase [Alkalibacterium olivapovliticus]PRY84147.1 hydroxyethylthiazole kinase-like uncharacterized protein yjeF [Alkalibacterium olivapovliticus]
MVRGLSAREIKAIDHFTINSIGIPSVVLMERAALSVTEAVLSEYDDNENFIVVCGTGNNGGDGVAIARLLHQSGKRVTLHVIGDLSKASEETHIQLIIARHLEMTISESDADLSEQKPAIIIDALFGIGLDRAVKDPYLSVIKAINQSTATILAVDIPSGLSADTGIVYNEAVRAKKTYTIGFWKKGFDNDQCRPFTGEIKTLAIGYPEAKFYQHLLESE